MITVSSDLSAFNSHIKTNCCHDISVYDTAGN